MVRVGVILGSYPPEERQRREDIIKSYANDVIKIEVLSVTESPYTTDLTGGEVAMLGPSFVTAAVEAERAGIDAIVPFGTLDIGVEAARTFLNIPIVGPFEAGLRLATFLGDRIGLVTYTVDAVPYQRTLARLYGLEDRVVGSRALNISLNRLVDNRDEMRRRFVVESRELLDAGAEVIIPAGVTMCPVWMSAASLAEEVGVPVVECVGAPIRVAALMAEAGLPASRKRYLPARQPFGG